MRQSHVVWQPSGERRGIASAGIRPLWRAVIGGFPPAAPAGRPLALTITGP